MQTAASSYTGYRDDYLTCALDRHESDQPELNEKYYLAAYPDCYFLVRNNLFDNARDAQRVCLYQGNVVNQYRFGDDNPHDLWLSNELRYGRKLDTLYRDMEEKAEELIKRKRF